MGEINITLEELSAEVEKLYGDSPEGFTTAEMADATGKSQWACSRLLRTLIKNGRAECTGRKRGKKIDGSAAWIPTYRLIKKGK